MNTFAVRLSFGSFLKLMVLGCFCGSIVMMPINAFFSAMEGGGTSTWFFLLAPLGGLFIGTIFGIAGFPVYAFLARKFPGLSTFSGATLGANSDGSQIAP